ncbi:hypothetical protein GCM10008024_34450 [Allgaiera indica]|uniref:Uncharacterized protein n=1 Tax=Allgaiera indica TaxID=765699 RepID=A0AAN4UU68_9RHOB|nr:hypothetical protein GCM10008024_34450 [Allgaiera indica]
MADAAKPSQIVTLRCHRCRRMVNFLAPDLVQIVGPGHYIHVTPFACTRCGTDEFVAVSVRSATREDLGKMLEELPEIERETEGLALSRQASRR